MWCVIAETRYCIQASSSLIRLAAQNNIQIVWLHLFEIVLSLTLSFSLNLPPTEAATPSLDAEHANKLMARLVTCSEICAKRFDLDFLRNVECADLLYRPIRWTCKREPNFTKACNQAGTYIRHVVGISICTDLSTKVPRYGLLESKLSLKVLLKKS